MRNPESGFSGGDEEDKKLEELVDEDSAEEETGADEDPWRENIESLATNPDDERQFFENLPDQLEELSDDELDSFLDRLAMDYSRNRKGYTGKTYRNKKINANIDEKGLPTDYAHLKGMLKRNPDMVPVAFQGMIEDFRKKAAVSAVEASAEDDIKASAEASSGEDVADEAEETETPSEEEADKESETSKENEELKRKIADLEARIGDIEKRADESEKRVADLEKENAELRKKNEKLEEERQFRELSDFFTKNSERAKKVLALGIRSREELEALGKDKLESMRETILKEEEKEREAAEKEGEKKKAEEAEKTEGEASGMTDEEAAREEVRKKMAEEKAEKLMEKERDRMLSTISGIYRMYAKRDGFKTIKDLKALSASELSDKIEEYKKLDAEMDDMFGKIQAMSLSKKWIKEHRSKMKADKKDKLPLDAALKMEDFKSLPIEQARLVFAELTGSISSSESESDDDEEDDAETELSDEEREAMMEGKRAIMTKYAAYAKMDGIERPKDLEGEDMTPERIQELVEKYEAIDTEMNALLEEMNGLDVRKRDLKKFRRKIKREEGIDLPFEAALKPSEFKKLSIDQAREINRRLYNKTVEDFLEWEPADDEEGIRKYFVMLNVLNANFRRVAPENFTELSTNEMIDIVSSLESTGEVAPDERDGIMQNLMSKFIKYDKRYTEDELRSLSPEEFRKEKEYYDYADRLFASVYEGFSDSEEGAAFLERNGIANREAFIDEVLEGGDAFVDRIIGIMDPVSQQALPAVLSMLRYRASSEAAA